MLVHQTISKLETLGLQVDKEADARDSRSIATRLKTAKLCYPAAVEDIDFRSPLSSAILPLKSLSVAKGAYSR